MPDMTDVSPEAFVDAAVACRKTAAIKAAVSLDIFSKIGRHARTVEELAETIGYYGDALHIDGFARCCCPVGGSAVSRLARVVVPGFPHHVTQRGNRRERVFFAAGDYSLYRDILAERCRRASVEVWAYCLMPNHVHLVMVPQASDGLARAIGEAHRQYTGFINARARTTGHLFQGRFSSVVMDEDHLMAAARYVALNPVRAGLVAIAADWPWSSLPAHLLGRDDGLVRVAPLNERLGRIDALIDIEPDPEAVGRLRAAEALDGRSGRPRSWPSSNGGWAANCSGKSRDGSRCPTPARDN
jgi:putative transposase